MPGYERFGCAWTPLILSRCFCEHGDQEADEGRTRHASGGASLRECQGIRFAHVQADQHVALA